MSSVEKVRIWGIAISQSVVIGLIVLLAVGLPAIGLPLVALYGAGAGMVIWAGRQQKRQQPTYPQDRA